MFKEDQSNNKYNHISIDDTEEMENWSISIKIKMKKKAPEDTNHWRNLNWL